METLYIGFSYPPGIGDFEGLVRWKRKKEIREEDQSLWNSSQAEMRRVGDCGC